MILLATNSRDFATDYIVAELRRRGEDYYRLDLDLLHQDCLGLDPVARELSIRGESATFAVRGNDVRAVLYRAPTHLRESSGSRWDTEELLQRHQWAAFARSLTVFDTATWVNHPRSVYAAENKPYQLMLASQLGFSVPQTIVANSPPPRDCAIWQPDARLAIKALDSFFIRLGDQDAFFYTQPLTHLDATQEVLAAMPVILQQYVSNKIDIRVTVVGDRCFAASVTVDGVGVDGDWRLSKNHATFAHFVLPPEVEARCVQIVSRLGLVFGAIDLAFTDGKYYFLEVNPTGEWAWLVDDLGLPIDGAITDALCVA